MSTVPGTAPMTVRTGLRDVRYGEVLLLREDGGQFTAEVWNTLGMNDCPQGAWEQLDAATIAAERGALMAILNGPRYWVLDSITSAIRQDAPETSFGSLGMFRAAVIDFGTDLPVPGPYLERSIVRETVFGFSKGTEMHELTNPDGCVYVMQAYSRIVDPGLTIDDLTGIGDRISPPPGWTFTTRTLADDLGLLSIDGVATVLQDDLQNTYQRVDRTQ